MNKDGIIVDVAEETRGGVMEVGRTRIRDISSLLEGLKKKMESGELKVIPQITLFPDEWTATQKEALFANHCCPYCGLGLRFARTRPIARCGRKKCSAPKPFVIRKSVLAGTLKIT